MIDLHNHILPGVDDGAGSVEEACRMAAALVDQGVTQACCTPHTTEWAAAGDEARIGERVVELQASLDERGIGLKLLPGSEAHLSPTLAADVRKRAVAPLNGSQYLLLEFPYDFLPPLFERVVFELQAGGVHPVIAHPERIGPIADDPSILYRLVHRGCLAQLTAMSLAGGFGPRVREVSDLMLEHRLVHAIASDAHDADPRGRLFAIQPA
ncbi:MAG TPA: CpsB/CapC family capsule biosynthesis tyrosine phosphatase, partial [Chloroflexota bacterium]|nr:CpsB/CapC family capsule biosynthesis tyrosine phosphatase [Chloroflexota bacterium]